MNVDSETQLNNSCSSCSLYPYPIGFIILRHVNNALTNNYWIECYRSIRKLYDYPIVIIDDNSNYTFITNIELINCIVVDSEYKKSGEILPYYYLYKNHYFDKAIIVHDSTFINQYIEFKDIKTVKFLWHFEHKWNKPIIELYLLSKLNNKLLLDLYLKKNEWCGCFGGMSCIDYNFLKTIQEKYDLFRLIPIINNRKMRMAFERIFGLVCCSFEQHMSYFGLIYKYIKWGYTYKEYLLDKQQKKLNSYPIIKIWSGR